MRLIDADKLTEDYIVASTSTNTECHRYISTKQIDGLPTVEAIPISWIEKKIVEKKSKFVGMWTPVSAMYEQVLEDWRRENG